MAPKEKPLPLEPARPAADRATKRKHEKRLDVLVAARQKAHDDWLVGISEAYEDGLTQGDIAYILGNVHPTSVGKYRRLGDDVREQRRGGTAGGSSE